MSYNATLEGGQEVFIPSWPASVALQELTNAGKYIGTDKLLRIAELDTPSAILAITESVEPAQTAGLIKHFVCSARMDGAKIEVSNYDSQFENNLYLAIELFCHVVKAQYSDFFEQGLAKANSQND